MIDKTMVEVMDYCGEYFAKLAEKVKPVYTAPDAITATFKGMYKAGDLVRIHGAYTGSYDDMREGDVSEVVSFDGKALTLDRKLHTRGTVLFIAYLEPPSSFLNLCEQVKAWRDKHDAAKGLQSESIDGYSYSVASNASGKAGWQGAFDDELRVYKSQQPTPLYYARNARDWSVLY